MSQAHYRRCGWRFGSDHECGRPAVAVLARAQVFGSLLNSYACHDCLNRYLDLCDARADGHYSWTFPEPLKIEWVWDAGTRECALHGWPAVLCEGWTAEHRTLRTRGLFAT